MRQSRIHTQQYDGAVHRCRRTRARTRTHARISRFFGGIGTGVGFICGCEYSARTDGDAAVTLEFAGQLLDWQRFPGLIGIFGDGIFGNSFLDRHQGPDHSRAMRVFQCHRSGNQGETRRCGISLIFECWHSCSFHTVFIIVHPLTAGDTRSRRRQRTNRLVRYGGIRYFTAPVVTPFMMLRWMSMKNTTTGNEKVTEAAICPPKSVPMVGVEKDDSHTGSVYFDWSFMNV